MHPAPLGPPVPFQTTQWSVVLAAGKCASSESGQALSELCTLYWHPVYSYVRRQIGDPENALDFTQEFFADLLERNTIAVATPERGRFRTFLLTACQNFLRNEWRSQQAVKRGGGRQLLSLDVAEAEARFLAQPVSTCSPVRAFERRWAIALLERALDDLESEYVRAGKTPLFTALRASLTADGQTDSYAKIAAQLGLTVGAVKVSAHRLRQRYGELIRQAITATVGEAADVEDELNMLMAALS